MEVAIAKEWKHTVHRWCKWHVLKRVNECLGSKYTSNKEFRDKFHLMLNEMLTVDEFEKGWAALLKQYGLEKMDSYNRSMKQERNGSRVISRVCFVQG